MRLISSCAHPSHRHARLHVNVLYIIVMNKYKCDLLLIVDSIISEYFSIFSVAFAGILYFDDTPGWIHFNHLLVFAIRLLFFAHRPTSYNNLDTFIFRLERFVSNFWTILHSNKLVTVFSFECVSRRSNFIRIIIMILRKSNLSKIRKVNKLITSRYSARYRVLGY